MPLCVVLARAEEGREDRDRSLGFRSTASQAKDVRVVVQAGHFGVVRRATEGGPNLPITVRPNAHSDSSAANQHRERQVILHEFAYGAIDRVGIVEGLLAIRSEAAHLVALIARPAFEVASEAVTGMIRSEYERQNPNSCACLTTSLLMLFRRFARADSGRRIDLARASWTSAICTRGSLSTKTFSISADST